MNPVVLGSSNSWDATKSFTGPDKLCENAGSLNKRCATNTFTGTERRSANGPFAVKFVVTVSETLVMKFVSFSNINPTFSVSSALAMMVMGCAATIWLLIVMFVKDPPPCVLALAPI